MALRSQPCALNISGNREISAGMKEADAIAALSALAQPTRLAAYRHLLRAGEAGLTAGALAEVTSTRPSTLSTNLATLLAAGLVWNRREGRTIRYHADLRQTRALLRFLLQDCCGGRAELCAPILETIGTHQ